MAVPITKESITSDETGATVKQRSATISAMGSTAAALSRSFSVNLDLTGKQSPLPEIKLRHYSTFSRSFQGEMREYQADARN